MSNQSSMESRLKAEDLGTKKWGPTIQSKVEGQHQGFRFKSKILKNVLITVGKTLKN
jgi:hypothetical protein